MAKKKRCSANTGVTVRMPLVHFFIYCSFGVASLLAQNNLPQPAVGESAPIDPVFHAPLTRGLTLVYADRFAEGLALFDSLQKAHPDHPGPHFYKAATYQNWMSSYRFNGFQTELYLRGRIMFESGRWPEVETLFREILQRLENHRCQSLGYQVECKYRIATARQQRGFPAEALALCGEALAQSEKRDAKTELESDLGSFSDMKAALKRLHQELQKVP